jgi:hypothetical protein
MSKCRCHHPGHPTWHNFDCPQGLPPVIGEQQAVKSTSARLIGPMSRHIAEVSIALRDLCDAIERDDGVDMTPLWERARRVLADNRIVADRDIPAPSIPLDALKAIAQGEPLTEVAGDYHVPLDVVKAAAPLVGRTYDPDVCLCRFESTCHVCAEPYSAVWGQDVDA